MARKLVFRIVTQAARGAGTTASVRVHHLTHKSGKKIGPFAWIREGGFVPGSTVWQENYMSLAEENLLTRDGFAFTEVCIGHDSVGDAGTGWLLQGVGVGLSPASATSSSPLPSQGAEEGEEAKEVWFPNSDNIWMGESDAEDGRSGPTALTLQPEQIAAGAALAPITANSGPIRTKLSTLETGAFAIPEASKMMNRGKRGRVTRSEGWAGEDAYFIQHKLGAFGVADGVSQWGEQGIDAGLFARELIRGAAQVPTLEHAFHSAKKSGLRGSSTLVICRVDLDAAKCYCETIGDSQAMLIRANGKVAKRTLAQEHAFGLPLQLSSDEDRDRPRDGLMYEWDLEYGDFLVVGSDGLFDNVGQEEISTRVVMMGDERERTCAQRAADLAARAFELSQERRGSSPYSRAASEALNLAFSGGKSDDITVIVARVL